MPLYSPNFKTMPHVTLSYAQSLDGSIARKGKARLHLSSPESLQLTHELRSKNDAILVGIGTVIADDPILTVRLIAGENPQPIIIDSTLRIPLNAKVFNNSILPWIFTTEKAHPNKEQILTTRGVKIFKLPATIAGKVSLDIMLEKIHAMGIQKLMVEGGRRIITSFLNENLADKIIITIAPIFVGGHSVLAYELENRINFPKLINIHQYLLGGDLIIEGNINSRD